MDLVISLLCAFGGTFAFAILFNIDRRFQILCGFTGMIGWMAYLFVEQHTSPTIATLAGSIVVVLIARIFSIWKKCPITVFMIAGIFPLIPGSSIYYAAYSFVTGDFMEAAMRGIDAVKMSFAIVVGIHLVDSIPPKFFRKKYWMEKRNKPAGDLRDKQ